MSSGNSESVLIILGGLPGAGKTSVARELARQIGAVHVRVDSIEQALRESEPAIQQIYDHGYRVAYAVAEDNLRAKSIVIADSVNPLTVTREAWRAVAIGIPTAFIEVEIVCTNREEHRRRVETRVTDIYGLKLPTWEDVLHREYFPWDAELVIDTSSLSTEQGASMIRKALGFK